MTCVFSTETQKYSCSECKYKTQKHSTTTIKLCINDTLLYRSNAMKICFPYSFFEQSLLLKPLQPLCDRVLRFSFLPLARVPPKRGIVIILFLLRLPKGGGGGILLIPTPCVLVSEFVGGKK